MRCYIPDTEDTVPVYLPLNGPGKGDKAPKAPAARGWQHPDYPGVDLNHGGWVGMRTDDLVVIDCDSEEAARRWLEESGAGKTYTVKTPRGRHFYYTWTPGSPTGPGADIFGGQSGIDIRAGSGAYVVVPPTPGYEVISKGRKASFKPSWVPERQDPETYDELAWTEIPEGRRNETLAGIAGYLRRQGMHGGRILQILEGLNEGGMVVPPLPELEIRTIAESVARYEPQPDWSIEIDLGDELDASQIIQWVEDMTLPPPPQWHWPPYLPKGRLVLLDGAEGIGKGLFSVYLATRITAEQGNVLWLSAEDDPEEDILRRLLAAGYDRSWGRIGFFTVDLKFPTHVEVLEQAIADTKAELVVLDPGRSFLAPPEGTKGFSYNDEAHIRPGLETLNRLAKRSGATIVFVHHWNKNADTSVQYRAGGSGAFSQVVRHRLTMAWHGPTVGGQGAFEISKSNIAAKGSVHGYCVNPHEPLQTATFELTDPLDFPDMGAWLKAMKEADNSVEIDMTEEILEEVRALPAGAPVPGRTELTERGIPQGQAKEIVRAMRDAGLVRVGARSKLFRIGEHESADA